MTSFVPCLCWVPKGVSKEIPDKVQLSEGEIQRLLREAQAQLTAIDSDGEVEPEAKSAAAVASGEEGRGGGQVPEGATSATVEEFYDLNNYDSGSDEEKQGQSVSGAGMGNSLAGLTYFASNDEDPYITLKKVPQEDNEEEDYRVLPSDNLLVVGRAEEEFSSVEVHVYSEAEDHSYCHHEILLTSFPLALEWLDFDPEEPGRRGSYLAVGMMSPTIEVWDLDVVDGLEPVFSLKGIPPGTGDRERSSKKKKKRKGKASASPSPAEGHSDAVLGLSWNRLVRNVLVSCSADGTARVWDMAVPRCVLTLPHPDKVQCVQWHPYEPELLATGGFDSVIRLFNCKTPQDAVKTWKVDGEVERLLWNHFQPELLLACTESKTVWCLHKDSGDIVFQIHAHTDGITDLSLSCHVPGLLVTASSDDTIKFWDIHENKPTFLLSKSMHMGAVLCARFCVDCPYSLATGGQKNGFQLQDVGRLSEVTQRFKDRGLMVPVVPECPENAMEGPPEGAAAELEERTQLQQDSGDEDEAMEVESSASGSGRSSLSEGGVAPIKDELPFSAVKPKRMASKKTKKHKS